MADIKISQLYNANVINGSDLLPVVVGGAAPCTLTTRKATVEQIVSGGFANSPISASIASGINSVSASIVGINAWTSSLSSSVQSLNRWTSSLSSSVQSLNMWTSSLSASVQTINAWTGSNTASFAGTASYALSSSYTFNLQEVTTKGNQTSASVNISASLTNGINVLANGDYSHAQGSATEANGYASHAEGVQTNAIGDYSHAEGRLSVANGDYSHAEGFQTNAAGDYSHAEGEQTTSIGRASNAAGIGTIAAANHQNVVGKYNVELSGAGSEAAFIIGNGAAGLPSNLLYAGGNSVQVTGSLSIQNGPLLVTGSSVLSGSVSIPGLALLDFTNDALAAAGGVPQWGLYRNGNTISIRVI